MSESPKAIILKDLIPQIKTHVYDMGGEMEPTAFWSMIQNCLNHGWNLDTWKATALCGHLAFLRVEACEIPRFYNWIDFYFWKPLNDIDSTFILLMPVKYENVVLYDETRESIPDRDPVNESDFILVKNVYSEDAFESPFKTEKKTAEKLVARLAKEGPWVTGYFGAQNDGISCVFCSLGFMEDNKRTQASMADPARHETMCLYRLACGEKQKNEGNKLMSKPKSNVPAHDTIDKCLDQLIERGMFNDAVEFYRGKSANEVVAELLMSIEALKLAIQDFYNHVNVDWSDANAQRIASGFMDILRDRGIDPVDVVR